MAVTTGFWVIVWVMAADDATEVATALVSGANALTALLALLIASRSLRASRQAQHEAAVAEEAAERERRVQRLERISELCLQILEASTKGSPTRWRLAQRRLKVALDAYGGGLPEVQALFEIVPSGSDEAAVAVADQGIKALDELAGGFEFERSEAEYDRGRPSQGLSPRPLHYE